MWRRALPGRVPRRPLRGIKAARSGDQARPQWQDMRRCWHEGTRSAVGSVWSDGSYARVTAGLPMVRSQKRFATQSRAVLRMTPTYSTKGGWFAQGQAELVAQGDQIVNPSALGTTDDLFVRIGKWNVFDVTVGRFQVWQLANHYCMGLHNTLEREARYPVPPGSRVWVLAHILLYRQTASSAIMVILSTDFLRFEVLGQVGGGTVRLSISQRPPVRILAWALTRLRGSTNRRTFPIANRAHEVTQLFGGALQLVLDPWIEAGILPRVFEYQVNTRYSTGRPAPRPPSRVHHAGCP